jgi:NAD(P)-dependent dehydrogenase (short-subunit alcohol dehydrogenase family)
MGTLYGYWYGPIRHKEVAMCDTQASGKLHRPVCLITGSSRGLGHAVAEAHARRDITVLISARDASAATKAAAELAQAGDVRAPRVRESIAPTRSAPSAGDTMAQLCNAFSSSCPQSKVP